MARGALRGRAGSRLPDPGRDARGSRAASADRHRPSDHVRDLPAGGRGGRGRRRPPAGDPARLLAAPHGLPGRDHDRLGHVHALPRRRGQLARAPRVSPDALPERPRVEPEPRGDGGAARRRRAPGGAGRGCVLSLGPGVGEADRRRCGSPSSAAWRTPASSRRRSTSPSTRRRSTWRRPSTSSATRQSEYAYMDWSDGPLKLMPWWSSFSTTGVQGRATRGTAEKGQKLLAGRGRGGRRLRPRPEGAPAPGAPETAREAAPAVVTRASSLAPSRCLAPRVAKLSTAGETPAHRRGSVHSRPGQPRALRPRPGARHRHGGTDAG